MNYVVYIGYTKFMFDDTVDYNASENASRFALTAKEHLVRDSVVSSNNEVKIVLEEEGEDDYE